MINVIHHDEATKNRLVFVDIIKNAHLRQELKCMPCLIHFDESQRVILLYVIYFPMTIEILSIFSIRKLTRESKLCHRRAIKTTQRGV